jgi:hypothetical protein
MGKHKRQMQRMQRIYYGQYGGGVNDDLLFYKASRLRQKGYGLSSFFASLAKRFVPFATKYILPHAKKAILNVANEVLDGGRPIKESLKDNALSALKNMGQSVVGQSGSGLRRRRIGRRRVKRSKITKRSNIKKKKTISKKRKVIRKKIVRNKIKSLFD